MASKDDKERNRVPDSACFPNDIADALLEGVLVLDAEGLIRSVNTAVQKQTGFACDELLGCHLSTIHSCPREQTDRLLTSALREGNWTGTIDHCRKEGSSYTGFVSCTRVEIHQEQSTVLVYCLLDISRQQRMEEQLLEIIRLSGAGAAARSIAHDLNNLLARVMGWADLALWLEDEDGIKQALEEAVETARKGQMVTDALLSCAPQSESENVRADVRPLVSRTLEIMARRLTRRGIRQRKHIGKVPDAVFDPLALQEVFFHLIARAGNAMHEGGTLTVTVEAVGEEVCVSVGDTGDETVRPEQTGLGDPWRFLGGVDQPLPRLDAWVIELARREVARFGGRLEVSANTPCGTRVAVFLPTSAEVEASSPAVSATAGLPPQKPGRRCRVLVVDDHKPTCDLFAQALAVTGHEAHTAYDGEEAIRVVAEVPVDVAVIDVQMPGRSGTDVVRAIRVARPDMGIILMTGEPSPQVEKAAKELNVPLLYKPFRISALVEAVSAAAE